MLEFDTRPNDGIRTLAETDKAMRLATNRATNRGLRFARKILVRALSARSGFPQKAIKGRRRSIIQRAVGSNMFGMVWQGTNAIPAGYLGKARQTKAGAKVRSKLYPGDFVVTFKSGHRGIMYRTGNSSLPIKERTEEIDHLVSRSAIKRMVDSRMNDWLDQELSYEFDVKPGRSI